MDDMRIVRIGISLRMKYPPDTVKMIEGLVNLISGRWGHQIFGIRCWLFEITEGDSL